MTTFNRDILVLSNTLDHALDYALAKLKEGELGLTYHMAVYLANHSEGTVRKIIKAGENR